MTNPYQPNPEEQPQGYDAYNTGYAGAPMTQPKTYLVWNILITLFCCLPFGIAGIVFSSKSGSAWNAGDYAGAEQNSERAKKMMLIGLIGGLIVGGIYIALAYTGYLSE
ncbi:CD225/dispanin family protein [Corynebacterium gerontici]|uniref:Interferon-induced transmembrane protein n=1 Tax=Corynebacterium gerontici TaxID=2079234 RepID=A0A3G6IYJ2_9CORY|nr:CD225/dispanin family protein [Corynebacterium gerontici]AZA10845.1 Interferon-induced transmembrane protein [Corynebacterium gerontici]